MNFLSSNLMLLVGVAIFLRQANSAPFDDENARFSKRNLNDFGNMIECETQRDKWKYNGYGCWCGYGGAGTPLDGVDRCCHDHDKCYEKIIAGSQCSTSYDPYVVSYRTANCSDCAPASDYNYWNSLGWAKTECRIAICECDSAAAKCFARNSYNEAYSSYDKSKCGAKHA